MAWAGRLSARSSRGGFSIVFSPPRYEGGTKDTTKRIITAEAAERAR